jgi:polysaccharide biosynthesis transport protein
MKFTQLLSILRARWIIPVSVIALLVLLAILAGQLLPKKYTASASVLVDTRAPDPINGTTPQLSSAYITTQMDIIKSERVALKMVRALRLTENADLRARWLNATAGLGSYESWVVDILSSELDIRPARDSNVIQVEYTATDPNFSALIANAVVKGYIDTMLELRVEPAKQFSSMFQEQLQQARDRLDRAQRKLSSFQQEKGILANDERFDIESNRLSELSAQLVAIQAQTSDAISRSAKAGMASPDSMGNPVILELKGDLARQETRLQEANSRYGDGHPVVNELKAGIAELKQRIAAESTNVGRTSVVNLAISQQKEAQTRAALEAQRVKVMKIKALRDEAQLMVKDVDSAQREVNAIDARVSQSSLESQSNQTNVSVLKVATPPATHSSPRPLLYILQAIFVGIFLGIGAAILVEMKNRKFRNDLDLTDLIGVELMGNIPATKPLSVMTLPIKLSPKLPSNSSIKLTMTSR